MKKPASLSPNDPLPFEKIAEINDLQGMQPEAIQAYLQAADLYLKQRDVEKAIDNWHKVLAFDPGHLDAHRKLALVHERLGRKMDAVTEYISIASLMQHRGETSKAIELVDYALRLVPDHVDALQAKNALQGRHPLPLPEAPKLASSAPSKKKTGPLSNTTSLETPKHVQDPIAEARRLALAALAELLFEQGDALTGGNGSHRRGMLPSPAANPACLLEKQTAAVSSCISVRPLNCNPAANSNKPTPNFPALSAPV